MIIRPGTRADAEAIATMLARLAADGGDAAPFATTPDTQRAQGLGSALCFPHYATTRGACVQDLWVAPAAREGNVEAS